MRAGWPARIATAVVTAVVLGPILVGGGYALRGDMVFTPDQPFKAGWLGLDGSTPRAVPIDALVSLADEILPGAVLQRLLLVLALVAGGLGIARLARARSGAASVAAVVVYLWNPWVHERLAIGQWPMVLGYGLLPWLVAAAENARERRPGSRAAVVLLLLGCAVCAPSAGLLGALVALAVVAPGRRRTLAEVGGIAVLVNLPWIVPALVGPSLRGSADQFGDFAARGESTLGTVASLLSMGGIWKSSVVPPERTHVVVVAAAALLALTLLTAYGLNAAATHGRQTARALGGVAVIAFLLALLPAVGPVGDGLGSLSADLPGLGILRDSQRYLAPLGLMLALGAAALVDRLAEPGRREAGARQALAGLIVLGPVVLLPSLFWGLAGDLRPVHYPGDWSRVADAVGQHRGATVVLPWTGSYRGYAWNDHRAVLDPAPRFLPGTVLVDDRTVLANGVLPGEDPYLDRVRRALAGSDPSTGLRDLGVRWVLVEKANGVAAADVPAGSTVYDGRWLRLVDLGAPLRPLADVRARPAAWPVLGTDVLVLLLGCVSVWKRTRVYVR